MAAHPAKIDVFTEREYKDGRQAEFINQLFTLRIAYYPPTSVYFRLSPKADGVCDTSVILQILPDHLALLRSQLCRWDDVRSSHPDDARQRLGGASDLTRLRFQLLSGMSAQIIVPKDSTGFKTSGSAARRAVHLFASLAASPSFCVYFPRNKLSKLLLEQCVRVVDQYPGLNEDDLRGFQRKVDPKRLYDGRGGMVLAPDDYKDGSRTDGERSRSTTPATNDSNGSTLDFDSVPRSEGPPPSYGDCLAEAVKPRATSDDKANSVESPSVGHAPPEYDGTELQRSVPKPSKRRRQCVNEDALPGPRLKKAPTRNAQCLDAKPRLESEDAGMDVHMMFRELSSRLDDQQQQIKQLLHEQSELQLRHKHQLKALQDEVKKLRTQNVELERRNSEMENTCAELTNRQETADEEMESIRLDTSELQEVTGEHGKQLADSSELAEELASFMWADGFQGSMSKSLEEHMDAFVKEYVDRICEGDLVKSLREQVQKKVVGLVEVLKAQMCETLK
ncbi:hypothetical protein K4K55_002431 [Colletotrichum sp. SAR 10_96]|nr:hypothetical protein K4K55_002431 [Colletotrichum sp. SAR 10_96]